MTDPFAALHAPGAPVDPDPAFAIHLRARLERALALPRGVTMSDTTMTTTTTPGTTTGTTTDAPRPTAEPSYRHGDVGYAWLSVPDLARATAFYATVLDWTYGPGSDDGGRQVTGRTPHLGLHAGANHGTLNCCYAVEDLAAATARVRARGGRAGEPRQAPYGLVADCTDGQGTVFALYQAPEGVGSDAPAAGGHGDLVYVTHEVVDSSAARDFYAEVLGWSFVPGGVVDGWQVQGTMAGLQGGHPRATTLAMWRVDDLAATVQRVRAAGGTATDPQVRPYGLEAECADDQGVRFYLGQL